MKHFIPFGILTFVILLIINWSNPTYANEVGAYPIGYPEPEIPNMITLTKTNVRPGDTFEIIITGKDAFNVSWRIGDTEESHGDQSRFLVRSLTTRGTDYLSIEVQVKKIALPGNVPIYVNNQKRGKVIIEGVFIPIIQRNT